MGEGHERFVSEFGDRGYRPFGEAMGGAGDEYEILGAEGERGEAVWWVWVGQPDDRSVVVATTEVFDEWHGVFFSQRDLDTRVTFVERDEESCDIDLGYAGDDAEAESPGHNSVELRDCRPSVVDCVKDGAGVGKQHLAGRSQTHGRGRAVEQLFTDVGFESSYLLADAGLRDVKLLGGAGEAAVAGNRNEVVELSELHSRKP